MKKHLTLCLLAAACALPGKASESGEAEIAEADYNPLLVHYVGQPDNGISDQDRALILARQAAELAARAGETLAKGRKALNEANVEAFSQLENRGWTTVSAARRWMEAADYEAATVLASAGHGDAAEAFFEHCLRTSLVEEIYLRCARSLAEAQPQKTLDIVLDTAKNGLGAVGARATLALGDLVAESAWPQSLRAQAFDYLAAGTGGLKKMVRGPAAIRALIRTRSTDAIPHLEKMTKGMMNAGMRHEARRALLVGFGDQSILPRIEKSLAGKTFLASASGSSDPLESALILIEAGVPSGFEWAARPSVIRQSEGRLRLIEALAGSDRPEAIGVLNQYWAELFAARSKRDRRDLPWVALALLEAGDTGHADVVESHLDHADWTLLVPRMTAALSRAGQSAGAVPALARSYQKIQRGLTAWDIALEILGGDPASLISEKELRRARTRWGKLAVVDTLSELGGDEAAQALADVILDQDPVVAASAALALTHSDSAQAPEYWRAAAARDFDSGGAARNPAIRAALALAASDRSTEDPRAAELLEELAAGPDRSVRLLAGRLLETAARD